MYEIDKKWLKDSDGNIPLETIETTGCTGNCQSFKDGLPNCKECSQFNKENEIMKRLMKKLGKCHPSNCPTDRQCKIVSVVLVVVVLILVAICCSFVGI